MVQVGEWAGRMGELVLPVRLSSKHSTCKMNLELEKTTWHASFKKRIQMSSFGVCGVGIGLDSWPIALEGPRSCPAPYFTKERMSPGTKWWHTHSRSSPESQSFHSQARILPSVCRHLIWHIPPYCLLMLFLPRLP